MTRTIHDVRKELRAVERLLERPQDTETELTLQIPPKTELIKQKTLLRHELKMFGRKNLKGKDAKRMKEFWRRKTEAERKRQEAEKKKERERIEIAKKELKKELSVKELEALLKKKKGKK